MSDTPNAAPAGAGEQAPAPQAQERQPLGPMSSSAAEQLLAGIPYSDEPAEAGGADAQDEPIETAADDAEPAEAGEGEPPAETPDAGADPETQTQPEAETDGEEKFAHGNMRTRLRDGTVTTVGELKKAAEEAREQAARVQEHIAGVDRQFQARAAQLAEYEKKVQEAAQHAAVIFSAVIPPEPDPALRQSDFLGYLEQKEYREDQIARLQQHISAYQEMQAEQQRMQEQARAAQEAQQVEAARKLLHQRLPQAATPEGAKEIWDVLSGAAKEYGISEEEARSVPVDPRMASLLYDKIRKAAAYDKLMEQRQAAANKVQATPPVQRPGARVSSATAAQRNLDSQFKQLRESGGNLDVAQAILSQIEY